MVTVVKPEPLDEDAVPVPPPGHAAAFPPETLSSSAVTSDVGADDEDEVVRTIDVCLSPELADTCALVQFPLQPAATGAPASREPDPPRGGRHGKDQHQQKQRSRFGFSMPIPESARIRPRHGMLELGYPLPRTVQEGATTLRSLPDALNLHRRTYKSHPIPLRTHMALGRLNPDGSRLDVIPLGRIVQMRPDFSHLDDDDDDDGPDSAELAGGKSNEARPLLFRRPESERTLAIKRSSYAHKRASEEGEDWIELEVCGPRSVERAECVAAVCCPDPTRVLGLAERGGDGASYVRSLNYLPPAVGDDGELDFDVGERRETEEGGAAPRDGAALNRELTAKIASLLQRGGGVPVPYPVLRSRFPAQDVSDEALAVCASACAVLVRGNFVVKSSLLGLREEVEEARDVILALLNRYGRVRREELAKTFRDCEKGAANEDVDDAVMEEGDDVDEDKGGGSGGLVSEDVVNALLESVAEATQNSVELKLEDDPEFGVAFPGVAEMHRRYWERRERGTLARFLCRYKELSSLPQ